MELDGCFECRALAQLARECHVAACPVARRILESNNTACVIYMYAQRILQFGRPDRALPNGERLDCVVALILIWASSRTHRSHECRHVLLCMARAHPNSYIVQPITLNKPLRAGTKSVE